MISPISLICPIRRIRLIFFSAPDYTLHTKLFSLSKNRYYFIMGKFTINFSCRHCGHCCRDVVCLPTPWDVVRLAREEGADPYKFLEFLSPDEIQGVSNSDRTWLRCNGTRYLMALRRSTKGCFFLDKRSLHCRAYAARPLLCRLYPFAVQESRHGQYKGFALHKDVECPRNRDDKKEAPPLYELYLEDKHHQMDYEDLVKFFNSRKSTNPWDFVKLFIQKV